MCSEDDRGRCGGALYSKGRLRPRGEDDVDIEPGQLCRQVGQPRGFSLRPSVLDEDVLVLDIAKVTHPLPERRARRGGTRREVTYPRNLRRLLCARRERPCNCSAAEKPDEFPSPHGIYSRGREP